jgi:hypothetical protein
VPDDILYVYVERISTDDIRRRNDIVVYPERSFSSKSSRVEKSTFYLTLFSTPRTMSRSSAISVERAKIAHDLRQSIGELKDRGLLVAAKWLDLPFRNQRVQTDIEGLANY